MAGLILIGLHHLQNALILFEHRSKLLQPLKIHRCLNIKAIPVHDDTPAEISTSYVERQNLTLRMGSKRFARLSNGFSKKIDCHLAAVSLGARHAACRRES